MKRQTVLEILLEQAEIPLEEADKYEVDISFIDSYGDNYYLVHVDLQTRNNQEVMSE
ncbi:hypothetical protein [Deinococcus ficus]|uniref:hypothetical protein n=1 Tax=Deinococcus ficus TaxID=317577 RepID=UPI001F2ACED7|nr:hypothetical protein [Deinococcus ficus]